MKKTRVQKMYKRFKNRVLRRKGVEAKQKQQLNLISSEPLADLRSETNSVDVAASSHSISRLSSTVQSVAVMDAVRTSTVLTSLPSRTATASEQESATILSSTAMYTIQVEPCSRREGPCSLAAVTQSSSTATDDRGRLHGTPAMHPMLSADSGVEVDVLESCCSCADDVFTEDDGLEDLLDDDGWQIAAHDVSLDKILHETSGETVYR